MDKSVLDTIEWIMPSLVRIYMGGEDIGQFDPVGPEDEEAAKAETEACNWYLQAKNDAFSQINATLRDALLLKNGYMVGFWKRDESVMTETYTGLSDEEVAMLMQDHDVNVVEHTEYPDPCYADGVPVGASANAQGGGQVGVAAPGPAQAGGTPAFLLHDVKVERKKADEFVGVESVPPDELLVSRRHRWTSVLDADFVEWVRRNVTIGQLREEGFKIPDDAPGYDDVNTQEFDRDRFADIRDWDENSPDPSRRVVTFRDAYIRIDLRGTGKPQLWRCARVDGLKDFALKEEADVIPFAAFSPIIYPHSHVGSSVYDLINDLSVIKTTVQRMYLDGLYQANSNQKVVDYNRVNLDDLLVSRPGNIIRVDGPPGDAVMPLVPADVGATALTGLEYLDSTMERRTGVTRYSAGLDANTLNKTATGVQAIQSAANQRIELIARTLASGFKDLFLIIHALACKHSTKPVQMKLKGKWTPVDPRSWAKRTDFSISVGLGTGTPETQLQKLMMLGPLLQQSMGMGLSGPTEMYNYGIEVLKAAGYKNPDKFIHAPQIDPQTGQPKMPDPPKDPMVQVEEIKQQGKQGELQQQGQLKQMEMQQSLALQQSNDQRQAELDRMKMEMDLKRAEMEFEFKRWLEAFKVGAQAQMEREKMAHEANLAAHQAAHQSQTAEADRQFKAESDAKAKSDKEDPLKSALAEMQDMIKAMSGPKKLIRGPDGRVSHVESAGGVQTVQRGPDGRATGVH